MYFDHPKVKKTIDANLYNIIKGTDEFDATQMLNNFLIGAVTEFKLVLQLLISNI